MSDLAGRVRLRALRSEDVGELVRIYRTPEVRRWWGEPEPGFPWTDDQNANRLVIEVEGAVAGMIQFSEQLEPRYRHASIDMFLDPSLHGRGLGTDALRQVVRYLIEERGHHRSRSTPQPTTTRRFAAMRRPASSTSASCASTSATSTAPTGTTGC